MIGEADVVEVGSTASVREPGGAAVRPAERLHESAGAKSSLHLRSLALHEWRDLSARAVEPNAYFCPDWASAVDASARGRTGMHALAARNLQGQLIGLLPVVSAWRAWKIPLPVLVSGDPYGPLGTPLLGADDRVEAARLILHQALSLGVRAVVLRDIPLQGPAADAFTRALVATGLEPRVLHAHDRACLDATGDAETLLRDAVGAKKLKDLRRQRNRLADHGKVRFAAASTPEQVAAALDTFLALEACGWKGKRGTALSQHPGDAAFIRRATVDMARTGQCEIITLHAGETPVAAGIVLRHGNRAFWFKLGVDERFAKLSPGVQLALDLTRHLCNDPAITLADSSTNAGPHSMIDPIWRKRLSIGDMILPLRRNGPLVPMLVSAIKARSHARSLARQLISQLHHSKEKRQ